jgi:Gas vesicle synthesis protein GvpL/GvpF
MKLYVYCLAEGIDKLDDPLGGISGAPVRLLRTEDFAVLASELEADTVAVNRENALAHAAVVRSLLDRTTPLPFRFGTLVDEQQLRSYVSARKQALESKLALVHGCVEMSVKIIWDISGDRSEHSGSVAEKGAGTTFLAAKRSEILGGERRAAEAAEVSTWLHNSLQGLTRDEQVTVRPNERLMLAAAHLVERSKIQSYREKVSEARTDRPELHFLLSGPWAPYSFANIELEFKTQFGVS